MEMHNYISINVICRHHNTEVTFISELQEYGLIEIVQLNNEPYILAESLPDVEKVIRLRNDLNMNAESIDVVFGLLKKIEDMQLEMEMLRSRLRLYEDI